MEQKTVAWATMLQDAVTQHGVISDCYQAFHQYSLGNQVLAYTQLATRNMYFLIPDTYLWCPMPPM